ncbi:hypothetical protein PPRY_a0574 [Pseudoalteromonas prydzensis ACAM 620]|nr:hypothetical protein [Pseudoalteromonas prydzensis ACAM 620]
MMNNDILNTKKLGYKFYFQDGDDQIACFGSYFTGKEEVYINDELVSEKRSINVTSKHQFELSGNTFNVKFEMHNILTGRLECSLYKNKKLVKSLEQTTLFSNPKKSALFIAGCFVVGFTVGYIISTLALGN